MRHFLGWRSPLLAFTLLLVLLGWVADGQAENERFGEAHAEDLVPWEPEDLTSTRAAGLVSSQPGLLHSASLLLIRWYQRDIGPRSVERCPFSPSCSRFAQQAIESHGALIGICLFIDRNLYRENPETRYLYGYTVDAGRLKLDDGYFLHGDN